MKPQKTLSNWLTSRYILVIRNEENFAEKSTFRFNYARLLLFIIFLLSIFLVLAFYLSTTLLSKWFDPRDKEVEMNQKLVELLFSVDSLAIEVEKKEKFIQSFKTVLTDGSIIEEGTANEKPETVKPVTNIDFIDPTDVRFRKDFEKNKNNFDLLKKKSKREDDLQSIFFLAPVNGIITSKYESKKEHFGVDVVSQQNEPIRSIAEGTIIMASWTQDAGYVIAVQHKNNILSIYKHNSALLKKVGNFVKAGDIISIIGNTGELTSGPHLHFELWYDGNPVDPENFISF